MNLRPIKDGMIVLPDPPVQRIGLIHVPEIVTADNPNHFTMTGVVVALGPGGFEDSETKSTSTDRWLEWGGARKPFDVAVGDRVLFNRFAGKQVTAPDDGIMYLVMRESDVLGKVTADHAILPGYIPASDSGVKSLPLETTR